MSLLEIFICMHCNQSNTSSRITKNLNILNAQQFTQKTKFQHGSFFSFCITCRVILLYGFLLCQVSQGAWLQILGDRKPAICGLFESIIQTDHWPERKSKVYLCQVPEQKRKYSVNIWMFVSVSTTKLCFRGKYVNTFSSFRANNKSLHYYPLMHVHWPPLNAPKHKQSLVIRWKRYEF